MNKRVYVREKMQGPWSCHVPSQSYLCKVYMEPLLAFLGQQPWESGMVEVEGGEVEVGEGEDWLTEQRR